LKINDSFTIEMGGRRFFATCMLKSDNDELLVLHCRSPLSVRAPMSSLSFLCLRRNETSGSYEEMSTAIEVKLLVDVVSNVWYN
jgi:hypothetical protein